MVKKKFSTKIHKWRLCPAGQYWRSAHIQSTYVNSKGVTVREHPVKAGCCNNPSKKDQIYSAELELIAKKYFSELEGPPTANNLGFKQNGNSFDAYIRGWTLSVTRVSTFQSSWFLKFSAATWEIVFNYLNY